MVLTYAIPEPSTLLLLVLGGLCLAGYRWRLMRPATRKAISRACS